jgi:ERF superfamily protein
MPVMQKLMEARVKLLDSELKKSGRNDYAGYSYFEMADFLPTALRIFLELKLSAKISITTKFACMKVVDLEDGSWEKFLMPMGLVQLKGCHEMQNIGAATTYARRYLWGIALDLVESDPQDALQGKGKKSPSIRIQVAEEEAVAMPTDMKIWLSDLARDAETRFVQKGDPAEAWACIDEATGGKGLTEPQKAVFWGLLQSSRCRSAMRDFKARQK